jgi:hypothetical protein
LSRVKWLRISQLDAEHLIPQEYVYVIIKLPRSQVGLLLCR